MNTPETPKDPLVGITDPTLRKILAKHLKPDVVVETASPLPENLPTGEEPDVPLRKPQPGKKPRDFPTFAEKSLPPSDR